MFSTDQWLDFAIAVVAGGAFFQFLGTVITLLFNRGKSLRDELREEIARLDNQIHRLSQHIDRLEAEVETYKIKLDEWRSKYLRLYEEFELYKIAKEKQLAELSMRLAKYLTLEATTAYEEEPGDGEPV